MPRMDNTQEFAAICSYQMSPGLIDVADKMPLTGGGSLQCCCHGGNVTAQHKNAMC